MKMLQAQSATNPILLPNHSFTTPKKSISPRRVGSTFCSNLPQFSVTCSHPELVQPKLFPSPASQPPPVGELPPRIYVDYSVYKGKAVLKVAPRAPEFTSMDSGAFKVSREGCVILQFAPSFGPRQYDWNKKQVFSLSVEAIGRLINLGAKDSCAFFHGPYLGKSEEGKVRKVLMVDPLRDGSGHMFNLSVINSLQNINEKISIPVTKAEFAVFNSLFNFIMPCLSGWSAFGSSIKPEVNILQAHKKKTMNESDRELEF